MTSIFFIRHAQSDFKISNEVIRPLTPKGINDSNKLIPFFEGKIIDYIFSSPYKRCIDTLKPLSDSKNIKIIINNALHERIIGQYFPELKDFTEFSRQQWNDFNYKLPNGECLYDVQKRNINVINSLLKVEINKSIVIGTHGTSLCTILNYFDYKYDYNFFLSIVNIMPFIIKLVMDNQKVISIETMSV